MHHSGDAKVIRAASYSDWTEESGVRHDCSSLTPIQRTSEEELRDYLRFPRFIGAGVVLVGKRVLGHSRRRRRIGELAAVRNRGRGFLRAIRSRRRDG